MIDDDCVELPFDGIYWIPHPSYHEEDAQKVIRLEWGWGVGLSEEEKKERFADGIPVETDSVSMTFEDAKELRDKLTELLEKHENDVAPETELSMRLKKSSEELDKLLRKEFYEPGTEETKDDA